MKECDFNEDKLKNECLKEVPKQLLEFYKLTNTSPEKIKQNDLEDIKNYITIIEDKNKLNKDDNNDDNCAPPLILPEIEKEVFISQNAEEANELNFMCGRINNKNEKERINKNSELNRSIKLFKKPQEINNNSFSFLFLAKELKMTKKLVKLIYLKKIL